MTCPKERIEQWDLYEKIVLTMQVVLVLSLIFFPGILILAMGQSTFDEYFDVLISFHFRTYLYPNTKDDAIEAAVIEPTQTA